MKLNELVLVRLIGRRMVLVSRREAFMARIRVSHGTPVARA